MTKLVLCGAGSGGIDMLRYLGRDSILAFADNDKRKQGTELIGFPVMSVEAARDRWPTAGFMVSIYQNGAREVRRQLRELKVRTVDAPDLIPNGPIPSRWFSRMQQLAPDPESLNFIFDQDRYRRQEVTRDSQIPHVPTSEIYFPEFIRKLDDEVYFDCGAADGDTVTEFMKRWTNYKQIVSFEPDLGNYAKLSKLKYDRLSLVRMALSDQSGEIRFSSSGNASHIDSKGDQVIKACALDDLDLPVPTFIKMDIEGSEIQALRGARKLIATHCPVLAICAYHHARDLWEIPLLLHSLQPEYELRFRRYAEGAYELVWYAIPKGRLC